MEAVPVLRHEAIAHMSEMQSVVKFRACTIAACTCVHAHVSKFACAVKLQVTSRKHYDLLHNLDFRPEF